MVERVFQHPARTLYKEGLKRLSEVLEQMEPKLPRDLSAIGSALGVTEVAEKPLPVHAMVVSTERGYKITTNVEMPHKRKFSWAHELAHVLIGLQESTSPKFRGNRASYRAVERVCDKLAAEILMPEELFRQQMAKSGFVLTSVPALARTFDTSIESTAIRFTDFLPVPAVLSKWKSVSGQLVHGWSRPNGKCRPYNFGIPKGNKARHVRAKGPYLAFQSVGVVQTEERLFVNGVVTRTSKEGDDYKEEVYKWETFPTESMAFGSGDYRYVLSLSKVGKDSFTPLAVEA